MDRAPLVSVLMSVHNGEAYVRSALDSIFAQSFPDFEMIVVDDGSTDGTARVLESYADNRLVLLENDENMGLTASLNRGLAMARGQYVARQDADDVSLPERLLRQVAELERDVDTGLLGTGWRFSDAPLSATWIHSPPSDAALRWMLLFDNVFPHSAAMFRRAILDSVGSYDEHFECAQDYELWTRMARVSAVKTLGMPLVVCGRGDSRRISERRRPEQQSAARTASVAALRRTMLGRPWPEETLLAVRDVAIRCDSATPEAAAALGKLFRAYAREYPWASSACPDCERRLLESRLLALADYYSRTSCAPESASVARQLVSAVAAARPSSIFDRRVVVAALRAARKHAAKPGLGVPEGGAVSPRRADSSPGQRASFRVTAVVCTRNRGGLLKRVLGSLAAQTLPNGEYEIVVVDNASTDDTADVVRGFGIPNLRYIVEPEVGLSAARNAGISTARGEFVTFLDDDAVAAQNWLAALVTTFEEIGPTLVVVGSRVFPEWQQAKPAWVSEAGSIIQNLGTLDLGPEGMWIRRDGWILGGAAAYRREALLSVGGFRSALGHKGASLLEHEEYEMLLRLWDAFGPEAAYYQPEACVWHQIPEQRMRRWYVLRRWFWSGFSAGRLESQRLALQASQCPPACVRSKTGTATRFVRAAARSALHLPTGDAAARMESLAGLSSELGRAVYGILA